MIKDSNFSIGTARRVARQIIDFSDNKRKEILKTFPSDMKCRVVEEMVKIRLENLRSNDGTIGVKKDQNE